MMQCHLTHEHDPHEWAPTIADPDNPKVLHLFGEMVQCPGFKNAADTRIAKIRDLLEPVFDKMDHIERLNNQMGYPVAPDIIVHGLKPEEVWMLRKLLEEE